MNELQWEPEQEMAEVQHEGAQKISEVVMNKKDEKMNIDGVKKDFKDSFMENNNF